MEQRFFLSMLATFLSQWLVHHAPHYTKEAVEAELLSHEKDLYEQFCKRFDPARIEKDVDFVPFSRKHESVVVQLACDAISSMLKTTFFLKEDDSTLGPVAFRFDGSFFYKVPEQFRRHSFPHPYYGLFFIFSEDYFGFHMRFQDLARGGLRTVLSAKRRESILLECYQLAWTQEKKNKDIAEGGAKGVLFLNLPLVVSEEKERELLYEAQKGYVRSLLALVHCDESGKLHRQGIVDYYKKPEYIYLGPDENMHDTMIEWIAKYSRDTGYRPASAFITGKQVAGINHKRYGVTSFGVNVFLEEVLRYIGLEDKPFTVKMTGGPDGDVAGNQILNLKKYYGDRVKLVAITDISGTAVDPEGLYLDELQRLFYEVKPIRFYERKLLSAKGFLLRKEKLVSVKKAQSEGVGSVAVVVTHDSEEPVAEDRVREISETAVHKTYADIFIPAGGRPRMLDEKSVKGFFDDAGRPMARAIIEGANVYLTQGARLLLEQAGVIIIKDASANKGGVISSSYEVLSSLVLSDEEFESQRDSIAGEILDKIAMFSGDEARLLLMVHKQAGTPCSLVSSEISDTILGIKSKILEALSLRTLPADSNSPIYRPFFAYCLPILNRLYRDRLMSRVPDSHKKAVISTYLASKLVYKRFFSLPEDPARVIDALLEEEWVYE